MENIIITNREACLVEEKTKNENNYQFISENNGSQAANILSIIKSENESNKINYTNSSNSESKSPAGNLIQSKSFCEKSEILSLDSNSNKDILTTNENFENENVSNKKSICKKINPKTLIKEYIGHVSEAHHYILDNEFIVKGYRINFHSCKRISRSLCMCHNETINIWTHFIGAILTILFMFLVIFNVGPINPESYLKSYFERKSKGNYSKTMLDRSDYEFKNSNVSPANSNKRIQFEFGNYLINDDSKNNKNNNEKLNFNKTFEDLRSDKTGNIKSLRNNNAVESAVVVNTDEKLKLKFIKNFKFGIRNNLGKKEVNQENSKFINNYLDDAIKINKNGEMNYFFKSGSSKLEIDNRLFQRINEFVDIENLKNYLNKDLLNNIFSSDIKNNTKLFTEDFNNVFISSTNEIIEKYNELLDSISNKNINLVEYRHLGDLNTFLQKVLNHLRNILSDSEKEIDFNLRSLQNKKEEILQSNKNPTELNQDSLNFNESITPKWPVLIHLISALFCLCCSTTFHLFSAYSSKVGDVLSRLDYAGISVLIAGSCFPPYYYMFCCTKLFLSLYLTFICTFAIIVFFISLMSKFNTPDYRRLRGFLFLSLGISTALPMIHYIFLFDESLGMIKEIKVIYWAIGGIIYISGCLIYIARFPERFCIGKFDFIGSSHQIWHIFVVTGVVFHHVASITNYHDRLSEGCPNIR